MYFIVEPRHVVTEPCVSELIEAKGVLSKGEFWICRGHGHSNIMALKKSDTTAHDH